MHNCTRACGKSSLYRLGKTPQTVHARDKAVLHAARLQLPEDGQPRGGPFRRCEPQAEGLFLPVHVYRQRYVDRARLHRSLLARLHHKRIEVYDRIDLLKRTSLPRLHLLEHARRNLRDKRRGDLRAVETLQRVLDSPRALALRVEIHDHVVQARYPALALLYDPGLETAVAIARNLQIQRTRLALEPLRSASVAGIAAAATRPIVRRVAEMMRQLPLQGRLESTLAYRLEQAPLAEYVPRVPFEVLQQLLEKRLLFVCKIGHRLHLLMKLCVRMTTYTVFRTRPLEIILNNMNKTKPDTLPI